MTQRIYECCVVLHSALVANAPKDTWNLALNSIRIVQEGGSYHVVVGGEIAPYAVYTNEPWLRGKNPNEGWIERTIEECLPIIRQIMSGALTKTEVEEWMRNNYHWKLAQHYHEHIEKKLRELERIAV